MGICHLFLLLPALTESERKISLWQNEKEKKPFCILNGPTGTFTLTVFAFIKVNKKKVYLWTYCFKSQCSPYWEWKKVFKSIIIPTKNTHQQTFGNNVCVSSCKRGSTWGTARPEREPPGHWMNNSDSENKWNESICPDQEMPCRTCSTTSSLTSFFFSEGGKWGHICVQRKQQHLEASTQGKRLYAHHASLSRGASLLSQLRRRRESL